LEQIRVRGAAALLDLDGEVAAQFSAAQLADWYRPWTRSLLRAKQAVFRAALAGAAGGDTSDEMVEARAIVRGHDEVAARLGMTDVLAQLDDQAATPREAGDLWRWAFRQGRQPTRAMYEGAAPTLELEYPRAAVGDLPGRLAGALLIGLGGLGLALALRRRVAADLPWRWPHALGVAAGLFYWLYLSPSLVGWLIVAASLFTALRGPWRRGGIAD
jgi:hypothetical protein